MKLTNENYYSKEADLEYMSVSQYKNFLKCEAATMAELRGEYDETDKEALIVGNYVHAWNEGTLDEYKDKYKDVIFNKKGDPYVAYKKADEMIDTLANDKFCMDLLKGEKEIILTGKFAGVTWKSKIDVLNQEHGYILDLKTTRNITELQWSEKLRQKVSFIEMYDYFTQMALYAEIERQNAGRDYWLEPLIMAVDKEDIPDHLVISLKDADRITTELNHIEENMPRILAVKHGDVEAHSCGNCRYCRMKKKLNKIVNYTELGGSMYGPQTLK